MLTIGTDNGYNTFFNNPCFKVCNKYHLLNSREDTESSVSWSAKESVDAHESLDNLSSSRADLKPPSNSFKIGNIAHYVIFSCFITPTNVFIPHVFFILTSECKYMFSFQ